MGEDEVSSMGKKASRIYTDDMNERSLSGIVQNMDHCCTTAYNDCVSVTEQSIEKRREQR